MPPYGRVLVLTDDAQLVADYKSGLPLRLLAEKHGIAQTTIWRRLFKRRVMMRKQGAKRVQLTRG